MIPISTDTPIRRTPWANYVLVAVNVIIFVLLGGIDSPHALGERIYNRYTLELVGSDPELYQFITYQFLHGGWAHIAGNMLFLWIFGNPVNAKMGHGPYVFFYLAGGVFAAVGYNVHNDHTMVGASGSIAAITTAYLALFPRSRITILYWFYIIGTFELPGVVLIVFKMILWDNILAPSMLGESNVAFGAHLAGYAFGMTTVVLLLYLGVLPRDQFDIVALWQRRFRRQSWRSAVAEAEARRTMPNMARPVSYQAVGGAPASAAPPDRVTELRRRIADVLSKNDLTGAAQMYEQLLDVDPRQVLPRTQQLDVANQFYTLHRMPQAVAAYEKYLGQYSPSSEADQVRLLLGIIYARDLQQYEAAAEHLREVCGRLNDARRREQCQHWLNVALAALNRQAEKSDWGSAGEQQAS